MDKKQKTEEEIEALSQEFDTACRMPLENQIDEAVEWFEQNKEDLYAYIFKKEPNYTELIYKRLKEIQKLIYEIQE